MDAMSTHHPKIQPDDEGVVVDGVLYTELVIAIEEHPNHSREIIHAYELGLKHRKQPIKRDHD